jgi:outer membrane protein assembly factor BamB
LLQLNSPGHGSRSRGPWFAAPALAAPTASWPLAGHDTADTWFQPAEFQISVANVGQLQTRWVFTAGGDVTATPIEADGVVYAVDWGGNLFAINAANGHAIWSHKIAGSMDAQGHGPSFGTGNNEVYAFKAPSPM